MMNQTKKRLTIINLAISMTDDQMIRDQIIKLEPLKSDEKLQEILTLLRSENYGQAQRHIQTYLDSNNHTIIQRTSQDEKPDVGIEEKVEPIISKKDQAIIDQFDLFITTPEPEKIVKREEQEEVKVEDYLSSLPEKQEKNIQEVDFNAMLDIHLDEVMSDNIELDETSTSKDTFFKSEEKEEIFDTENVKKDTFFKSEDIHPVENDNESEAKKSNVEQKEVIIPLESPKDEPTKEALFPIDETPEEKPPQQEIPMDDISVQKENKSIPVAPIQTEEVLEEIPKEFSIDGVGINVDDLPPPIPTRLVKKKEPSPRPVINYKNIPYIAEKFESLKHRHPPIENSDAKFASVTLLTQKIKEDGYTEEEIEETIDYINILKKEGNHNEAAKLLLLCAATESKFGQFMLARELFKGQIVEKNMSESFSMMNSLALEGFPEALCDLGQFYENGLGIYKDVKKAGYLYKEAVDNGIGRAQKHYDRLSQQYKKLFK